MRTFLLTCVIYRVDIHAFLRKCGEKEARDEMLTCGRDSTLILNAAKDAPWLTLIKGIVNESNEEWALATLEIFLTWPPP
mmetsp:Transcript_1711/g.3808  ORF Transcript_1711/g.3808 Transcript_1711/m.3808 type:complete len:80 (+) Transcript_1711:66-305(+)